MKAVWLQWRVKNTQRIEYHVLVIAHQVNAIFFFIDFHFAENVGFIRHTKKESEDPATRCIIFDKQDNVRKIDTYPYIHRIQMFLSKW